MMVAVVFVAAAVDAVLLLRFEVLMVASVWTAVFWVVALCNVLEIY
jgi:hypothetical protein